jgi:hypothetical protein
LATNAPHALDWHGAATIGAASFKCGYCGRDVGPNIGYFARIAGTVAGRIFICSFCTNPTFFDLAGTQIPGSRFGNEVGALPDEIAALYREARDATAASAYTAAVLCCRKILMHVAVANGAKENISFLAYVEYLADSGYVPPNGKGWVDHIRKRGNDANHEIVLMKREDAEELVAFTEMLLKFVYEFPSRVPQAAASTD